MLSSSMNEKDQISGSSSVNTPKFTNEQGKEITESEIAASLKSSEDRRDLSHRDFDDRCEVSFVDEIKAFRVKENFKPERVIMNLAETFKVLGDPTRLKILFALVLEELCVCDLAHLLNMTESAISHQLRLLRNLKIVKHRKEGKMVYYSLDDAHVTSLLREASEHIEE